MAVPGRRQLSLTKDGSRAPLTGRTDLCPEPSGRRRPPVLTKHSAVFAPVQEPGPPPKPAATRRPRSAPWVERTFEKNRALLAVLAERNEAVAPVGAWVECASPCCEQAPASVSASLLEAELKEQQRLKEEALKRFQEQVKSRVNRQMRLRKKQQLQKSFEAAEKESFIAMQSSDSASHLTPKSSKSIYQSSLKSAIRSMGLSLQSTQTLGYVEEEKNDENGTFQQQALALSQTVKQARQQLASRKATDGEKPLVLSQKSTESSPIQEETYVSTDKQVTEKPPPYHLPGKIQDQQTKEKTASFGLTTDITWEPAEQPEEEGEPQRVIS